MFRRLSIRGKLLGMLILTTCVALLVAGVIIVAYDFVTFKRQRLNELSTQAEMLGAITSAALTFDDPKAAHEYLAALALRPSLRFAAIYDAKGRVFASYQGKGLPKTDPPPAEGAGHRMEGDDLLLFRPIRKDQADLGTVYLRANLGLRGRLWGYAGIVLTVMVASLGVALMLSTRLQALISQPLLEVAEVAHGVIEREDYSPRVQKRSQDEVGVLVDAFNRMLSQIEMREADLKQTNQALKLRSVDLARSNADLERFAYVASHDLQEPLRMVSSFTQLLARRYEGRLDAEADEFIHYAVNGARTMQSLIRDLLAFSRVGSEGSEPVPTSLATVVAGVRDLLNLQIEETGATLRVGELPTVKVDPGQMAQVFQNLIGNAIKFRAERPLRIEIGSRSESPGWTVWVKDNGIGIQPQFKERIFVIFQRLHARDEYPGTGIGLSICKRILERHGGTIWVESEPDVGSTFSFRLPSGPS